MTVYEIDAETNRISKTILDCAYQVHSQLGPGIVEKVYEECLVHLLKKNGLSVERQKYLPVIFDGLKIDAGLRLDLLIEDKIIVELKAAEKIHPLYEAQLHTYMKLSGKTLGLILNFNVRSMKDGIKRIAIAQNQKQNFV